MVPADTDVFSYSDVAGIAGAHGVQDVADMGFEEREDLVLDLREQGFALGLYPSSEFPRYEDIWGWDLGDVVWDMQVVGPGSSAYFVALGSDFDYQAFEARLEERDYERSEAAGFPLYSHPYDISEPWLVDNYGPSSPRDVLNIGIVAGEGLVLSPSASSAADLLAVRDGAPSLADDDTVASAVAELEDPRWAVMRRTGKRGCEQMWAANLGSGLRRELERDYAGRPHEVLAAGAYMTADERTGRAVMGYASPAAARDDLALRRRNALEGISLDGFEPYRADHFTPVSVERSGSNIVLDVEPADSGALSLVGMMYGQDLLFAAC